MKITITVKTRAKHVEVSLMGTGEYRVSVKEAPVEGKANNAVRRSLAAHFGVAPSRVKILKGATSKKKLVEIT